MNQDSDQVQRIRRGEGDDFSGGRHLPRGSQGLNRDWQGKLLAQESIHETAAANFSAIFQSAKCHLQLTPLG